MSKNKTEPNRIIIHQTSCRSTKNTKKSSRAEMCVWERERDRDVGHAGDKSLTPTKASPFSSFARQPPISPITQPPYVLRAASLFFFLLRGSRISLIAARPKEPVHRWLLDYIPVSPGRRKGDKGILDFAFPRIIAPASLSRDYYTARRKDQFLLLEVCSLVGTIRRTQNTYCMNK